MSLQITTGARSLISMGVSIGDLAVVIRHGRSIGNWLRAADLDAELFESILEQQGALLKRRGLIDAAHMKQRWSQIDFIYEGHILKSSSKSKASKGQDLTEFSWLMVTVVTALDRVLPASAIKALLVDVFAEILEGDEAMKESLRIQLPTNVEAWRSVGCVRNMVNPISTVIQKSYLSLVQQRAVPQLNTAEREEMRCFLIWLMAGTTNDFKVISATAYSVTESLRTVGVYINTKGERRYESEPTVRYVKKPGPFDRLQLPPEDSKTPIIARPDVHTRDQLFSYPRGQPEAMIDAMPLGRDVLNRMNMCWKLGSEAAVNVRLVPVIAETRPPFNPDSDIYYKIEDYDLTRNKFGAMLYMIAERSFPAATQLLLQALEDLTRGIGPEREAWLHCHAGHEYLQKGNDRTIGESKDLEIWAQYQALVFGFYYKLLEPLVSLEYVQEDVFFRGLWGDKSTRFLAMCTHFASCIRKNESVNRTHILYMLATMYAGRPKSYSTVASPPGLLGVLGPMSVLAAPLLRTTDVPDEIAKFVVVDLPVIDLLSDFDELYSGHDSSIQLTRPEVPMAPIIPHGPTRPWTVHAKLGRLYGETQNGVMMAARCDGRLVGWFGPLAADLTFLSNCYQTERHVDEPDYVDESVIQGHEITDEDWQNCLVPRALVEGFEEQNCVVHSRGCAALRYAATGFLASIDEEIAIATDDASVAAGRSQARGAGVVIA